jgi:hypothetical protein
MIIVTFSSISRASRQKAGENVFILIVRHVGIILTKQISIFTAWFLISVDNFLTYRGFDVSRENWQHSSKSNSKSLGQQSCLLVKYLDYEKRLLPQIKYLIP